MLRVAFLVFSIFNLSFLFAQNIPVSRRFDDELRALQLSGKIDPNLSLTIRPGLGFQLLRRDPVLQDSSSTVSYQPKTFTLGTKFGAALLPATITQQFNSHHPYGWNDGSMIPAKGYQTQISAGGFMSWGPIECQVQPEFVFAANASYPTSSAYGFNTGKSYLKMFSGQSYFQVSAFSVAVGISTENLWWGPGRRASLLMSNNAPGFFHGFIRTKKPLKTPIGNFEWQIIGAELTSDDKQPFENANITMSSFNTMQRYQSAMAISYNPRWIPGLFLGFTRSLQNYSDDINRKKGSYINKYIPILFKPVQKKNAWGDDTLNTDQLASFFLRYVFLKAKAEFYIEYGYNDYGANTRDYLLGTSHSAAYTAGFKKVIEQSAKRRIEFGIEITQMSQTPDWIVRNAGNWYIHGQIAEGYTYQNQILGAGAGLGANVFSIDATWVNGQKRLGFLFERVNRNPQYNATKWIDLGLGILPQWQYKNMVMSGIFEVVRTRNYLWEQSNNVFNIHARVTVQYNW